MPLPHWTSESVLPPGCHPADLSDIYERFVWDAPHRNERELPFSALNGYIGTLAKIIPAGRAWVGGGFSTRIDGLAHDVDVVVLPDEWGTLKRMSARHRAALYGMMTLRGVIVEQPVMHLEQVQPVGGLLDGFLCRPGDEDVWHQAWSAVTGPHGRVEGLVKGYAELSWGHDR